ncbi:type II toxin-antitoxin system VapC family toxin [Thiocapsa bogorovii]|uniref:type II toxin-antitoxin system VapC family toxin n=1 Tax=Thiocapsa bogorovii TaxID=521689 RepID=UPI001E389F6C|nr:type II toxin-antitoxin system VapC family toxin [Thiocapsa bogorovii]UHD15799.1 type II toxin-antitoxin system VapC family toxin [Thiocapsa bogorovii]
MIILDTKVFSEILRAKPAPTVEAWLAGQDGADMFLTAISEAELRDGVAVLTKDKRREALAEAVNGMLREDFRGRVLPFDSAAALEYASIGTERRAAGRPISEFDCQIAAIARAHGVVVATRNVSDFEECGVAVIDSWQHAGGD